jgi:hypothetical protein
MSILNRKTVIALSVLLGSSNGLAQKKKHKKQVLIVYKVIRIKKYIKYFFASYWEIPKQFDFSQEKKNTDY